MNRQKRKKRTDIIIKDSGSILDLIDDSIKSTWFINDDEYDFICENATTEEIDLFIGLNPTYSNMKKALEIIDRLLATMYTTI
tara:strand:+ start:577 stop:825 length:249 start_codon:yes stop_codon:yes gene_type:complete